MTEENLFKALKEFKKLEPSQEAYEKGLSLLLQKVEARNSKKINEQEFMASKANWTEKLFAPVRVLSEGLTQSKQLAHEVLKVYSSHVYASVLITVLVFGAFGLYSGMEANKALPDNKPLYTLKTALEKTQLTLSFSSASKAEKRVDFLARRVDELNQLVVKTAANPESNGHAVELAIINTQNEISAVLKDLANVTENEDAKEINEIKKLVEEKISIYHIALGEVHEDLPDNIKADLGEDVQALSSAILEINDAISYVELDQLVEGAAEVATSTASDLEDIFITGDNMASTTITTTIDLLIADIEAETVIPIIVEEPFTIENDTFEIGIGN